MKHVYVGYDIRVADNKDDEEGKRLVDNRIELLKQKKSDYTALLVYRCADCDTVIATTKANAVFAATQSQVAAETQELRCSKCEEKY